MTQPPDDKPDDETGRSEGDRKLDEDAAWRAIVENYGERATLDVDTPPEPAPGPAPAPEPPTFTVFERRWEDPLETEATWEDEGHFVPPEPPPLPKLDPRRRLAWIGLFGAPVAMLIGYLVGLVYPSWLVGMLVAGFFGGFGYLVATMPRDRPDDSSGDNGAVV